MLFSKKDLTRLIVPLIIEQVLTVLVGMIDVVMVAAVGQEAVSGVSLVDSVNLLLIQLLGALATGGAVVSAQYLGSKKQKEACQSANQLLLFNMILSLILMAIALIGNQVILRMIFGKVEESVFQNAVIYFYLSALSYPFLGIYNSCAALYRSMGNSKVSMYTSMVMNLINVVGNTICIYGLRMGVAGVGIPTLISRAVAAIIMLIIIRNPNNKISIDKYFRFGFHPKMIKRILAIGIPNGLENSMFQFGKILLQSLVSSLGTASIASFAVASNIVTLEYLPGNALGLGLITIVGQCIGAGEYKQVKHYTKKIITLNYIFLFAMCIFISIFASPIVAIYNLSKEAALIGVTLLILHSIAMIIWPISFTLPNTLRASSDSLFTMIISVFSMWSFRIGFSYLFVSYFHMGVIGIWIAMFIDWGFRSLAFAIRFHGFEKRMSI